MFFQLPYLPEILVSMGDYSMIKSACKKGPTTDDDVEAFKYSMSRPGTNAFQLHKYFFITKAFSCLIVYFLGGGRGLNLTNVVYILRKIMKKKLEVSVVTS